MKMIKLVLTISLVLMSLPLLAIGDYWGPEDMIPNALGIGLTQQGFDHIEHGIEPIFPQLMLFIMDQQVPLEITNCITGLGNSAIITDFLDIQVESTDIELTFNEGEQVVDVYLMMENPVFDFVIEGRSLFCTQEYSCNQSRVMADTITANGFAELNSVEGEIVFELPNLNIDTVNLSYADMEEEPDLFCAIMDIIWEPFVKVFDPLVDMVVSEVLKSELESQISDMLSQIPYEGAMTLPPPMEDITIHYDIDANDLYMIEERGLSGLDSAIWAEGIPCAPVQPGSRKTESNPPIFDWNLRPWDFAMSISDDFMNDALFTVYESGAMCMRIDQEFLDSLGIALPIEFSSILFQLMAPELYSLAGAVVPIVIETYPISPTWVEVEDVASQYIDRLLIHVNSDLEPGLDTEGIRMEFYMIFEEGMRHVLSVDMGMDITAEISLTAQNRIKLEIPYVDVVGEVVWEELIDIDDGEVERMMPAILQMLISRIVGVIPEIPLPTIKGYGFEPIAFTADGEGGDYYSIYGTLFKEDITDIGEEVQVEDLIDMSNTEFNIMMVE